MGGGNMSGSDGQGGRGGIFAGKTGFNGLSLILLLIASLLGTATSSAQSAPAVTSVLVPSNGHYKAGDNLDFIVTFSEAIVVNTTGGTPQIPLFVGSTTRLLSYVSGSGTSSLAFRYTVQPDDLDLDGVQLGSAIELNGGTMQNAFGEATSLTLNNAGSTTGVLVDARNPTVTIAVIGNPPSNATEVTFQIVFSEPVTGVSFSDFILTTTGTVTATLSGLQTSDNITYTLAAQGISGTGTLRLDLPAGSAQDATGNSNLASSGTPWTVGPSSNADLSQLQPSEGTLTPAFDPNTLNYSISVANNVTEITLTPTVSEPNATVVVNGAVVASGSPSGPIALAVGSTTINVTVTAQDGTVKTYEVSVTRAASSVADLAGLATSEGTLDPVFSPGTFSYNLDVANQVDSITITPTASEPTATITVNGTSVASGAVSPSISLPVGPTAIPVVVTAADGTTTQTYTVNVTRAAASNASLSGLVPSAGALDPAFSPNTLAYNISVSHDTDRITIRPTASDPAATITVDGSVVISGSASGTISLVVGSTEIPIVVTAQDGSTTQTYMITVTRAVSAIAELSALVPSAGTLDPAFSPNTAAYDISVGNEVQSISFTPTASDPAATITVNGAAVPSGATSAPLALSEGANQFSIVVTAQDGMTARTYVVSVTRSRPAPIAISRTIEVVAGTTATVDLTEGARGGPFTTASLTSVPDPGAGAVHLEAAQKRLSFDASPAFSGTAKVGYTLSNAFGTSAPASVTFVVVARPDPTEDAEVAGLLRAQVDTARRFAQYQTRNFNNRLEQLHDEGDRRRNSLDIRLGYRQSDDGSDRSDVQRRLDQMGGNTPGLLGYAPGTDASSRRGESASGDTAQAIHGPDFGRLAVWSGGFVDFAERDKGGLDIDSTTVGVSAGMDYRFSDRFVGGFGIGYGRDKSDIGDNGTESRGTAYSAAVYGSYKPVQNLFLDGLIGGSWLDFDSTRYVTGTGDFARGSRDGRQLFGSLTAAYEFRDAEWLVSPYGRVELSRSWLDGFTEKGGGIYGLTYGDQTVDTTAGVLGMRASYAFKMDWGTLTPGARAEYTHDFAGSSRVRLGYTDIGTLPYAFEAEAVGNDYATLGLSLDAALLNDWMIGLEYRTAFGSGRQDHAVGLRIGTSF